MPPSLPNTPILNVNLSALIANYRQLREQFSGAACAAVVKADAYGLGMATVAPALATAGCDTFFVATLEEGVALRTYAPKATLYVFHGPYANEENEYQAHGLIPVINSPDQLARWLPTDLPYALHVDTGMNRLGFSQRELENHYSQLTTSRLQLLMSHLACGSNPQDDKNVKQLERFRAARQLLPDVPASLCNSSGIFLSTDFHFDLARPGCALYGINPTENANPMRHVATLSAPVLQFRNSDQDDTVGYGATCPIKKGTRLATVQLGYADGYLRILSNIGQASIGGHIVPLAGRVTMDMVILDVSTVPESLLTLDMRVEFINAQLPVDTVAAAAQTIGYEVFTRLGTRVRRFYSH